MTLQELSDSTDFEKRLADEFPQGAASWPEGLSRRKFLQLMGASLALAGLNGCMRLPEQKIVPYVQQPEKLVPGRPLHFATTLEINGHPRGVVVTQHDGRPTHVAGNPLHPLSLGAADVWTMASLLDLYDPERLQNTLQQGVAGSWTTLVQKIVALNSEWKTSGGRGLCLLTPPLHSPTEWRLLRQLLQQFPEARWYVHDPIDTGSAPFERFNLAETDVIFAMESNFLYDRPDSLALTRTFSQRRRLDEGENWNRLYVAESCPTITGVKADHRFPVAPQDFDELAIALRQGLQGPSSTDQRWPWLPVLIDDLRQHPGRSVVTGGRSLSEMAREALLNVNQSLGNIGKVISFSSTPNDLPSSGTLADLAGRMKKSEVTTLLILGGNPVYDAPADIPLGSLLGRVPLSIHHTLYANETSAKCSWAIPVAHDLEAWGDAEACDGTLSLTQPLIVPLYQGKSREEILALVGDGLEISGYDLVRQTWQVRAALDSDAFETQWHRWLRDGMVQVPAASNASSSLIARPLFNSKSSLESADKTTFWLSFRPGDAMWDGRHANNGWLQELPDPITKLTWDNAALLSPTSASQLGIRDGDVLILQAHGVRLEAAALVIPGHAERCVTLPLGYGRMAGGSIGKNVGSNAYFLRRSDSLWQVPLEKIAKTGRTHSLARTQEHFRVQGRDLLHVARVDKIAPALTSTSSAPPPLVSLYPEVAYEGHRWALTIDLNTCIGCNACIIACQSENNIPIVGKAQVLMGREMQWIRVDRYHEGPIDNPRLHFQPVPCMQCEKAPCEVVCPVAATQHDDEGLNVMIYNRCVGTRYCSNNCPYKVRRFNFLFYNADIPESQRLRLNPNVTVRSRGVMEKCTYCVQRIEEARIAARREHRPLRGNDIVTACQATCPADAIAFGDLSDPNSAVSKNRRRPGHYAMLEELDTRPRTTYLEKRINPNPILDPPSPKAASSAL